MLKVINAITSGAHYVKKVAAILACFVAAADAWHDKWLENFPEEPKIQK